MKNKTITENPASSMAAPVSKPLLGLGALILIAQVVMIFSNRKSDEALKTLMNGKLSTLQSEVGQMKSDIGQIKSEVGNLDSGMTGIRSEIGRHVKTLDQIQKVLVETNERNARMRPRVIQPDPRVRTGAATPPFPEKPPLETIPLPQN